MAAKDRHYWIQLRIALTGGQWDAPSPGKAPNAALLSWSELLRKFNKHCIGHADVAELASQTQALSLLLAANASDQSLDGNDVTSERPLALGQECVLAEERVSEALAGYNVLKGLDSSKTDSIRFAVAYYAYALGHPSECLTLLQQSKDLTDVQAHIPQPGTVRSTTSTLQVPSGADSSASSWTGSFATTAAITSPPDISEGRAWATTECIRSACLQGMSHEKVSPSDPQEALDAYLSVSSVLKSIGSEIPCSLPSKTGNIGSDPGSFIRYRELWRWAERLMRRAIILAAYLNDLDDESSPIWSLFDHYRSCSAHWPANFRPLYRSNILVLHLRALILRTRISKPPRWTTTARSIVQECRSLLSVSTVFPRAGERNEKVEDFIDLCVAVWEADGAFGEDAGWVIDMLWWATRLTFNSFRVFRHMTHLFSVAGDPELAKRTLRLYVQIVSKAKEATVGENDIDLSLICDTDRNWVTTLIHGARMLCRLALQESDYGTALEGAKEAGVLIEKAKTRLDRDDEELVAEVQLAEAIWCGVMAHTEQDPLTRDARLQNSLTLLRTAVGTYPSPSIHHHLALALSRPGESQDVVEAIAHARSAVEGDATEVRHWHLLGLLLAATGDWQAAKGVLEFGVEAGEADIDEEGDEPTSLERQPPTPNGLNIKDFAVYDHTNNGAQLSPVSESPSGLPIHLGTLLDVGSDEIPPSASLLRPYVDRPPSSRYDRFEHALQARMTQLALTEFVEGAEGVGEKWLEVFQWFREKRGVNVDDRRVSIDSRRPSVDATPLSEIVSVPETSQNNVGPYESSSATPNGYSEDLPTPIPITITPATPAMISPQSNPLDLSSRLSNGHDHSSGKRTSLDEKDRDISRGKKVKQVLKTRVHKGQVRISTISKKIGHGVGRRGSLSLKRTNSAPDFHSVLGQASYQASSIHLRQFQSIHASQQDLGMLEVPPPPPSPTPVPADGQRQNTRTTKDRRLLSDLWLMSAAIFRRLGKIEQARGAIQEAEVRDEDNPAVWVQLGLYHTALGDEQRAIEAFQKALFISPNDVAATVHLCRLYLSPLQEPPSSRTKPERDNVDFAAGLLHNVTQGTGWDVPEAWYFLAKAYKLQGRLDRERECLSFALTLSESRGVRDIGAAVGWCL